MKKKALLIGTLVSIFLCFYLLLRKDVLKISEVDFYSYRKPICKNGQLEFHQSFIEKSSFENHFAILKSSQGESIIPLILIEEKKSKFYFKPRDPEVGCLSDINYVKVLSFKNKITMNDLKVNDSKISGMEFKDDEVKCVDHKIVPKKGKFPTDSVDLGGVEIRLISESDGKIDILKNKEFTIRLNGNPYLFISLERLVKCEKKVIPPHAETEFDFGPPGGFTLTWLTTSDFFSLINLDESKLVGTKETGSKKPD